MVRFSYKELKKKSMTSESENVESMYSARDPNKQKHLKEMSRFKELD